jgi:hypothetical protein
MCLLSEILNRLDIILSHSKNEGSGRSTSYSLAEDLVA